MFNKILSVLAIPVVLSSCSDLMTPPPSRDVVMVVLTTCSDSVQIYIDGGYNRTVEDFPDTFFIFPEFEVVARYKAGGAYYNDRLNFDYDSLDSYNPDKIFWRVGCK